MSQTGGGLGGNAIFAKCWKSYFPQIRLPRKKWSSKLFQSPRGGFSNNANLTKWWRYYFPLRKTASKCVILKTISKSQSGVGFGGNAIFTKYWKLHSPQIRLPQTVCSNSVIIKRNTCHSQEEVLVTMLFYLVRSPIFLQNCLQNLW